MTVPVLSTSTSLKERLSADELALVRTLMAAERTLLAWVRTAMAFISFGVAMIKILESIAAGPAMQIQSGGGNRIGLFLMFVGAVPLAVGMYQFYQTAGSLGQKKSSILTNPSFLLACVILLLGIVLFLNAAFEWNLL